MILKSLYPIKVYSPDNIPIRMLQLRCNSIILTLRNGVCPDAWKEANMVLCSSEGRQTNCK